jgi:hypothetical protein
MDGSISAVGLGLGPSVVWEAALVADFSERALVEVLSPLFELKHCPGELPRSTVSFLKSIKSSNL